MIRLMNVPALFPFFLAAMLGIIAMGCDGPAAPRAVVVVPEKLEIEGTTWTKQAWKKKLDQQLASYFSNRPQVAENPALQGQPVCYINGSTKRIYWVSTIDQTCQWILLEFKGSRAGTPVEGVGAPFLEVQTGASV